MVHGAEADPRLIECAGARVVALVDAALGAGGALHVVLEEVELVQILMAYKQQRGMVDKARQARGLPSLPDNLDVKRVLSRVKCYECGKPGRAGH